MSEMHGPVVAQLDSQALTTTISTSRHRLVADEPSSLGGADQGPSPHELLLASVGACKAITMRMYAGRKGWPLHAVRITLTHARASAAADGSPDSPIDVIEAQIDIEGELDAQQRARLIEIADRCPIHRILTGNTVIRTGLSPHSTP